MAIEQATKLSSLCPIIPKPLQHGAIDPYDMHNWFYSCSDGRVLNSIRYTPHLTKPGYYLSLENQKHSVIFVDWVGAVGGDFYVIDSNGWYNNTVALYNRGDWYDSVFGIDFAGKTY